MCALQEVDWKERTCWWTAEVSISITCTSTYMCTDRFLHVQDPPKQLAGGATCVAQRHDVHFLINVWVVFKSCHGDRSKPEHECWYRMELMSCGGRVSVNMRVCKVLGGRFHCMSVLYLGNFYHRCYVAAAGPAVAVCNG